MLFQFGKFLQENSPKKGNIWQKAVAGCNISSLIPFLPQYYSILPQFLIRHFSILPLIFVQIICICQKQYFFCGACYGESLFDSWIRIIAFFLFVSKYFFIFALDFS